MFATSNTGGVSIRIELAGVGETRRRHIIPRHHPAGVEGVCRQPCSRYLRCPYVPPPADIRWRSASGGRAFHPGITSIQLFRYVPSTPFLPCEVSFLLRKIKYCSKHKSNSVLASINEKLEQISPQHNASVFQEALCDSSESLGAECCTFQQVCRQPRTTDRYSGECIE